MLIPATYKSNTEPTSRSVSPVGQERVGSMGKQSEADNASGKNAKTQSKNGYSLHSSCNNLSAGDGNTNTNTNNNNNNNNNNGGNNGSLDCAEEDDDLALSDGDQFCSIEEEEEEERQQKSRIGRQGDEIGAKLKLELSKYKQELKEYNETTKDLEKKYMKINFELNEMQQKHVQFVKRRSSESSDIEMPSELDVDETLLESYSNSATSIGSAQTVKHTNSSGFRSNTSFMTVMAAPSFAGEGQTPPKRKDYRHQSKIRKNAPERSYGQQQQLSSRGQSRRALRGSPVSQENDPMKNMYCVLKDVINTPLEPKMKIPYEHMNIEFDELYSTIKDLKSEQLQFRSIIRQQQERITDYHTRCVKAQEIMKTQKNEIDKLQVNNKQLESSIYQDFDSLRSKIDSKLKCVAQLPQMMREEHSKYEKVMRENCIMADKLRDLQKEASQLKSKIDELGKRKLITVNRLKAAERDLKIFKNYNTALKAEKRRIAEELNTTKLQLDTLQAAGKRQLTRHREQTEKQRRELQKRVFDLELKLSRSQNSTSSLIQERDSLIAELQTQLHTLVHNFEVSQKHIRVLRRHIYTMTSGGGVISPANCSSAPANSACTQRSSPASEQSVARNGLPAQPGSPSASRLNTPRTLIKNRA